MFISHTSELRNFPKGTSYVAAVERAISADGHVIVDMVGFGAADQAPAQVCAERVRGCDVYVGVLGTRYGSPVRDKPEVSYTELEFETATEAGLDRLVFLLDTDADDVGIPPSELIDREFGARQDAFRRRVQDSGLTQSFASPAELGELVERSLHQLGETRPSIRHEQVPAEQRTQTLNERFSAAAGQLGSDKPSAVRLAGVYAMAGLADDWEDDRQTCVDMLCAYLRMPYETAWATPKELQAVEADREVRHTIIRVIATHLSPNAKVSWQGLDFDFTGVVFDGGDFRSAQFSGGTVSFSNAWFSSGPPRSSGGKIIFSGEVNFAGAKFSGATVSFASATFAGSEGSEVHFDDAEFTGGTVSFDDAEFSLGPVSFDGAKFTGSEVRFDGARFSGSKVSFDGARFSGSKVNFAMAAFTDGTVSFSGAAFTGGEVSFGDVGDWSHPPTFDPDNPPPTTVVKLPGPRSRPV